MLAALSIIAVLVGGVMFANAPSTDEAVASLEQDKAKVEYVAQKTDAEQPRL